MKISTFSEYYFLNNKLLAFYPKLVTKQEHPDHQALFGFDVIMRQTVRLALGIDAANGPFGFGC